MESHLSALSLIYNKIVSVHYSYTPNKGKPSKEKNTGGLSGYRNSGSYDSSEL